MENGKGMSFIRSAPEECRSRMSEELENAPTYRMTLEPKSCPPRVISVNAVRGGEKVSTQTELSSRSLGQKLVDTKVRGAGTVDAPKRYERLGILGEGGTGTVYEMEDHNTRRRVAIKVLKSGSQPEDVNAFIEEGILASELEHPNIIPVYDLDADATGQVYLSMKKVEGKELLAYVNSQKTRDYDDLVLIFLKVCDALSYAHSLGKTHQDVKPDNVMVGMYGEVFLIDWGAASQLGNEMQLSPVYMSPQQAAGDDPIPADDVYCLGASLFHVLTNRYPTNAETIGELWDKKLEGIVDPLSERILNKVPQPLLAIAMKAMEPEVVDRYQSIEDVAKDLKAYQSGFATSAENAGAWLLLKLLLKRRWKETVSLVAALIILLGASFSYYFGIQKAKLNAEHATLDLKREEVARLDAELKAEKMERDRQEQWLEVLDQDFATNPILDPRLEARGTPSFADDGLLLGFESSLGMLWSNEHIGLEQKVEVSFSCKSPSFLSIGLSMNSLGKGYGLELSDGGGMLVEHGKGWNVLSMLDWQAIKTIRYDRPNTVVFWRERNRFFATINGVPALEHTVVSDVSGSENGFFHIRRYFAYHPLRIHSIRVWRRQEPLFVSALAQGRTLVRAGNVEEARNLFLHQSRNCPSESVRQEAQFLAARLAPNNALKLKEFEEIIQNNGHAYRAEALHECAGLLASVNWRRALEMAIEATRIAPQLRALKDVLPEIREYLIRLPLQERMTLLNDIAPLLRTSVNLQRFGLRDITFLQKKNLHEVIVDNNPIDDLSPLRGMSLKTLDISGTNVTDLSALKTMPLKHLSMNSTAVRDLSPLKGKELWYLSMRNCPNLDMSTFAGVKARLLSLDKSSTTNLDVLTNADVAIFRARHCGLKDISFLKGMKPMMVALSHNEIVDLSPLANSRISILDLGHNRIRNVEALRGCRIGRLDLNDNPFSDISPLFGVGTSNLNLARTTVKDISPLATMRLKYLNLDQTQVTDFSPLLSIPTLESLSIKSVPLDQQALDTLAKLQIKSLTMNLDKVGLTLAARMKSLETFCAFKREYVLSIAPTVLQALNMGSISRDQMRTLKNLASKGVERHYLLLPIQLGYDDAKALCSVLGGTLACPDSEVQANHLADYLRDRRKRYYAVWTGVEPVGTLFTFLSGADPAWCMTPLTEDEREKIRQGERILFMAQARNDSEVSLSGDAEISGVVVEWSAE